MRYSSAAAFRAALEDRLNALARTRHEDSSRLRKIVTFERFLARVQLDAGDRWLLKGGFAMLLRQFSRARTTKDVDLGADLGAFTGEAKSCKAIHGSLKSVAMRDLGDAFAFEIREGDDIEQDHGPVQSFRYPVTALLDSRTFARFHVDVGLGDPLVAPAVDLPASGLLDFAELPPAVFRAISVEQHWAEKVHALTRPWEDRENTRVRDLVDLMLLLDGDLPAPDTIRRAVEGIFAARRTHAVPSSLADPPTVWVAPYAAMAVETGLAEKTVPQAMARLRTFWKTLCF